MEGAKILEASKLPIGLGLVVILIGVAIGAISLLGGWLAMAMPIVSLVYQIVTYLLFLLLFAWAGYRAVKKFGLDLVGAAAVGALSALALGIVSLVLNFIVLAVVLGSAATTTSASAGATAVTAGLVGMVSFVFGIIGIIGSVIINAAVAGIGGLLAKGK